MDGEDSDSDWDTVSGTDSSDDDQLPEDVENDNGVCKRLKWPHMPLQDELDKTIASGSAKNNLSVSNVKNIIWTVLTHDLVKEMLKSTLQACNEESCQDDICEPKLTRLRMKKVLEKGSDGKAWPMSPVKLGQSSTAGPSILDVDFAEDEEEEDEEYHPGGPEAESDEESAVSSCVSDMGSPFHSPYPRRPATPASPLPTVILPSARTPSCVSAVRHAALTAEVPGSSKSISTLSSVMPSPMGPPTACSPALLRARQRLEFVSPVKPDQTLDDGIARRTRSKLPLTTTSLNDIEEAFVAPDITPDMYDTKCDDTDWQDFLKSLHTFEETDTHNETMETGEDDDPEFNYSAAVDNVQPDVEEARFDAAFRVSRKELTGLLEELEDLFDENDCSMIGLRTNLASAHKNVALLGKKPTSASEPLEEDVEPGPVVPAEIPDVREVIVAEKEPIAKKVLSVWDEKTSSTEVVGVDIPDSQRKLIAEQMRKHVQLITQMYVLTQGSDDFHSMGDACRSLIEDVEKRCMTSKAPSHSLFNACNLQSALQVINSDVDWASHRQQRAALEAMHSVPVSSADQNGGMDRTFANAGHGRRRGKRVIVPFRAYPVKTADSRSLLLDIQKEVIWRSPAFLYPSLLPSMGLASLQAVLLCEKNKFTKSEDALLILGKERFQQEKGVDIYELIHKDLLPCKTAIQLRKHFRQKPKGAKHNLVWKYRNTGEIPQAPQEAEEFSTEMIRAPCDQPEHLQPKWGKIYQRKLDFAKQKAEGKAQRAEGRKQEEAWSVMMRRLEKIEAELSEIEQRRYGMARQKGRAHTQKTATLQETAVCQNETNTRGSNGVPLKQRKRGSGICEGSSSNVEEPPAKMSRPCAVPRQQQADAEAQIYNYKPVTILSTVPSGTPNKPAALFTSNGVYVSLDLADVDKYSASLNCSHYIALSQNGHQQVITKEELLGSRLSDMIQTAPSLSHSVTLGSEGGTRCGQLPSENIGQPAVVSGNCAHVESIHNHRTEPSQSLAEGIDSRPKASETQAIENRLPACDQTNQTTGMNVRHEGCVQYTETHSQCTYQPCEQHDQGNHELNDTSPTENWVIFKENCQSVNKEKWNRQNGVHDCFEMTNVASYDSYEENVELSHSGRRNPINNGHSMSGDGSERNLGSDHPGIGTENIESDCSDGHDLENDDLNEQDVKYDFSYDQNLKYYGSDKENLASDWHNHGCESSDRHDKPQNVQSDSGDKEKMELGEIYEQCGEKYETGLTDDRTPFESEANPLEVISSEGPSVMGPYNPNQSVEDDKKLGFQQEAPNDFRDSKEIVQSVYHVHIPMTHVEALFTVPQLVIAKKYLTEANDFSMSKVTAQKMGENSIFGVFAAQQEAKYSKAKIVCSKGKFPLISFFSVMDTQNSVSITVNMLYEADYSPGSSSSQHSAESPSSTTPDGGGEASGQGESATQEETSNQREPQPPVLEDLVSTTSDLGGGPRRENAASRSSDNRRVVETVSSREDRGNPQTAASSGCVVTRRGRTRQEQVSSGLFPQHRHFSDSVEPLSGHMDSSAQGHQVTCQSYSTGSDEASPVSSSTVNNATTRTLHMRQTDTRNFVQQGHLEEPFSPASPSGGLQGPCVTSQSLTAFPIRSTGCVSGAVSSSSDADRSTAPQIPALSGVQQATRSGPSSVCSSTGFDMAVSGSWPSQARTRHVSVSDNAEPVDPCLHQSDDSISFHSVPGPHLFRLASEANPAEGNPPEPADMVLRHFGQKSEASSSGLVDFGDVQVISDQPYTMSIPDHVSASTDGQSVTGQKRSGAGIMDDAVVVDSSSSVSPCRLLGAGQHPENIVVGESSGWDSEFMNLSHEEQANRKHLLELIVSAGRAESPRDSRERLLSQMQVHGNDVHTGEPIDGDNGEDGEGGKEALQACSKGWLAHPHTPTKGMSQIQMENERSPSPPRAEPEVQMSTSTISSASQDISLENPKTPVMLSCLGLVSASSADSQKSQVKRKRSNTDVGQSPNPPVTATLVGPFPSPDKPSLVLRLTKDKTQAKFSCRTLAPKPGPVIYSPPPLKLPKQRGSPKKQQLHKQVRAILPKGYSYELRMTSPTKVAARTLKKKATKFCQRSPNKPLLPKDPAMIQDIQNRPVTRGRSALLSSLATNLPRWNNRGANRQSKRKEQKRASAGTAATLSAPSGLKKNEDGSQEESDETGSEMEDVAMMSQDDSQNEEETGEMDNGGYMDELMAASTTIGFNAYLKSTPEKDSYCSKMELRRQRKLSLLVSDVVEKDPRRGDRDLAYAQSYMNKVKIAMQKDPNTYMHFIDLLRQFEDSCQSPVEVYKSVSGLLSASYPDLLEEFSGFLSPGQALQAACHVPNKLLHDLRAFLRKLEVHYHDRNVEMKYQKILRFIGRWDLKVKTPGQLHEVMKPLLCTLPEHIHDDFVRFFPDLKPSDRHMETEDFENVRLPSNDDEGGGSPDDFENITFPDENDPYRTLRCPCCCHKGAVSRHKKKDSYTHCNHCCLKVVGGQLYFQPSNVTTRRPVSATFFQPVSMPQPPDPPPPSARSRQVVPQSAAVIDQADDDEDDDIEDEDEEQDVHTDGDDEKALEEDDPDTEEEEERIDTEEDDDEDEEDDVGEEAEDREEVVEEVSATSPSKRSRSPDKDEASPLTKRPAVATGPKDKVQPGIEQVLQHLRGSPAGSSQSLQSLAALSATASIQHNRTVMPTPGASNLRMRKRMLSMRPGRQVSTSMQWMASQFLTPPPDQHGVPEQAVGSAAGSGDRLPPRLLSDLERGTVSVVGLDNTVIMFNSSIRPPGHASRALPRQKQQSDPKSAGSGGRSDSEGNCDAKRQEERAALPTISSPHKNIQCRSFAGLLRRSGEQKEGAATVSTASVSLQSQSGATGPTPLMSDDTLEEMFQQVHCGNSINSSFSLPSLSSMSNLLPMDTEAGTHDRDRNVPMTQTAQHNTTATPSIINTTPAATPTTTAYTHPVQGSNHNPQWSSDDDQLIVAMVREYGHSADTYTQIARRLSQATPSQVSDRAAILMKAQGVELDMSFVP